MNYDSVSLSLLINYGVRNKNVNKLWSEKLEYIWTINLSTISTFDIDTNIIAVHNEHVNTLSIYMYINNFIMFISILVVNHIKINSPNLFLYEPHTHHTISIYFSNVFRFIF